MEFVNASYVNACFLNTVMGKDHMMGAVIARPTFVIDGDRLTLRPDDAWPIDMAPMQTPYGEFPGDTPFLSGGVDVFVMGHACQPEGKAGPELTVEVRVGSRFRRSLLVIGDRRWQKNGDGLVPSDPERFTRMHLGYENAFGGKVPLEEGVLSFPANPHGKGYCIAPEEAEGVALPNLEDPEHRIAAVTDQPEPVGTAPYPQEGSLRALNAADLREDKRGLKRIKPVIFNSAHPRMIIPVADAPNPADTVEVTNVRPEGDLRFTLPDLCLHVHVQLEERNYVCPLHLDQIGILADENRVFLSYRVVFKYRVVSFDRRAVTLHRGELPSSVPPEYVTVWGD